MASNDRERAGASRGPIAKDGWDLKRRTFEDVIVLNETMRQGPNEAALLERGANVLAVDIDADRLETVRENLARLRLGWLRSIGLHRPGVGGASSGCAPSCWQSAAHSARRACGSAALKRQALLG